MKESHFLGSVFEALYFQHIGDKFVFSESPSHFGSGVSIISPRSFLGEI
jgi:hypothetical protein